MSCSSAAASIALRVSSSSDLQLARQRRGVGLHPPDVAVRDVVLGVDRHRQRLDRRVVQPIDLRDVPAGVFQPSERRPQRGWKMATTGSIIATAASPTCRRMTIRPSPTEAAAK